MFYVVTTRFNDETWNENICYREKNNIKCVYCSPLEMSQYITLNSGVFVIEMNNSKNKIEGVGFIKNRPCGERYYRIYSDGNYNRYVYKGNYYLSRDILLEKNEKLVNILDYILFKEKTHLKRGSGFTSIPEKLMKHPSCENINIKTSLRDIFINYYTQ
jgi:hypothetical protein